MKSTTLFLLLAALALTFEINMNLGMAKMTATAGYANKESVSTPVSSVKTPFDGLKWSCESCGKTCAYGGFPYFGADAYYCVCTYSYYAPTCVPNIC